MNLSAMRQEVFAFIQSLEGADATGGEVNKHFREHYLALDDHKKAEAAWRTNLSDLCKLGLLVEGERRICRVTGERCKTFRLREVGSETNGVTQPKPKARPRKSKGERLKDEVRENIDKLMDLYTEGLEEADRIRLRKLAHQEQSRIFGYIQAMCRSASRQAGKVKNDDAEVQAVLDRQEYERACGFFGVKPPKGGFIADGEWMWNYRDKIKNFAPDHNEGRVDPTFTRAVDAHQIIKDYHDKYRPKTKAKAKKEAQAC